MNGNGKRGSQARNLQGFSLERSQARYQADPETFRRSYDDLLASTGLADAATLAERFGIDLHAPAFWQSSFAVMRQEIDRFQALVEDRNT